MGYIDPQAQEGEPRHIKLYMGGFILVVKCGKEDLTKMIRQFFCAMNILFRQNDVSDN